MEFERAIYRVYERCMDGLRDEPDVNGNANTKSCRFLEVLSFAFGGFLLFVLVYLHFAFVGSPGCLPQELMLAVRNASADGVLLRPDQILYINIDKRFQPDRGLSTEDDATGGTESASIVPVHGGGNWSRWRSHVEYQGISSYLRGQRDMPSAVVATLVTNMTNLSTNTSLGTTDWVEPKYDYKFSFNSGLLMLPYAELMEHQFTTINVTLLGTQCYGGQFTQSIMPIGGVDTVIVNALMYTFKQPGHVFTGAGDYFRWTDLDLHPYRNAAEWVGFKVQIVCYSLFAFFLLTTITALMVRILISSGVVLIFPIFWLLQALGFAPLNLRVVALSYPWIGVPLEMIRGRNQSIMPFLIGHMSRVLVYYFLYQATQIVFAVFFYNRDSPGQQELWIFGVMMLWEYYSMIYVRARGSIVLFPRAALALFLIYHFYYFSFPAGFHVLALVTMFFFLVAVMVHCIRVFEIKDYERGVISLDQPRALYNSLPFPVWNGDLAPEYTLMMPVTHRSVSAYQATIPAINPTGGGNAGAGVGAGAARQAGNPLGANAAGGATANPLQQQQAQAPGSGASSSGPVMTVGADVQRQERQEDSSSGSAGIEMGSMQNSVLQSVLGSLRGAGGGGAQGGAGARGTAAYRRLEDQSSNHGGADDSEV